MQEYKGVVTMKGAPLTLVGSKVQIGQQMPEFEVIDNKLSSVSSSTFAGKVCIICSVPSLDTSVCDMEIRKFNEEAAKLGDEIAIITVSMDLPFAQSRWCGSAGIEKVSTFSDYQEASFGKTFGVLIKELRLLARSIFVADREGVIRYIEIVSEIADEPNYEAAIEAAKKLV